MLPNSRGTWKVRSRPQRARRKGGTPSRLRPASRTSPRSGRSSPLIRLTSVVLPAPLGPIRPRISSGIRWRVTSWLATRPPKRLLTPSTASRASDGTGTLPEEAGGTDQQERDQEQEPVRVLVGGRDQGRAQGLGQAEHETSHQCLPDRAEAADDDDLEALGGGHGAVGGVDEVDRRQEAAGQGGQRDPDAERDHVQPEEVDASRLRAHPVLGRG